LVVVAVGESATASATESVAAQHFTQKRSNNLLACLSPEKQ
jgi:hypothetical protein